MKNILELGYRNISILKHKNLSNDPMRICLTILVLTINQSAFASDPSLMRKDVDHGQSLNEINFSNKDVSPNSSDVAEVIHLLDECPPWNELSMIHAWKEHRWTELGIWKDPDKVYKIEVTLRKLDSFSTATLRSAVIEYYEKKYFADGKLINPSHIEQAGSKIYVLNRYIFAVPAGWVSPRGLLFGGIVPRTEIKNGHRAYPTRIDPLWPFIEDYDKSLHLTYSYGMYLGVTYNALGEFDFLNKTYGRRNAIPSSK